MAESLEARVQRLEDYEAIRRTWCDYLFSRAFQLMVETGNLTVLNILSGASAIIAEGEVMQLNSASNLAVTEEHYMRVVSAKTAALFAAAILALKYPAVHEQLSAFRAKRRKEALDNQVP